MLAKRTRLLGEHPELLCLGPHRFGERAVLLGAATLLIGFRAEILGLFPPLLGRHPGELHPARGLRHRSLLPCMPARHRTDLPPSMEARAAGIPSSYRHGSARSTATLFVSAHRAGTMSHTRENHLHETGCRAVRSGTAARVRGAKPQLAWVRAIRSLTASGGRLIARKRW